MDIKEIKKLIEANSLDEASEALKALTPDAESLYLQGRVAWKRGRKGEAISFYEQSEAIDPDGPASVALEQAREVMDFFNKDLLNP